MPAPVATALPDARAGFTLIELLVVVAISAILMTIAVPYMGETIARSRTADAGNALKGALDHAKTVATSENYSGAAAIFACRVADPTAAAPTCTNSTVGGFAGSDWAAGWVVFVDYNGNGVFDTVDEDKNRDGRLDAGEDANNNGRLDGPDVVLWRLNRFGDGTGQRVVITANAGGGLRFNRDGVASAATIPMTFMISDQTVGNAGSIRARRCLTVSAKREITLVDGPCG